MTIANVGSVVLHLVVFLTTLVNFNSALAHVEPVMLICIYILFKLLARTPDDFLEWLFRARATLRAVMSAPRVRIATVAALEPAVDGPGLRAVACAVATVPGVVFGGPWKEMLQPEDLSSVTNLFNNTKLFP
ncbi:hypothetical protein GGS23DRAFT_599542 [Durotheca rogersii]|uniref:uncharacterized protein n=1 Tax=Durotheca rogersii TaxID=419775 RepID=UPI00221F2CDB|nr:uncharacterized protein GGS23DRAFT_599542 [Durotheca rogersii]KAI5860448.1 hypothetical protein GGS23DRAFT_599542 [Durotheca rogersii]